MNFSQNFQGDIWTWASRYLFNPTVMLASFTGLGYINALMFEIGYLNFYGINYQLAHVTIETFILFGALVLFASLVLFSHRGLIMLVWRPNTYPRDPILNLLTWKLRSFLTIAFLVGPFILYYDVWKWAIPSLVVSLILVTIKDILIDGWGEKGVRAKIKKSIESPIRPVNLIDKDRPIILAITLVLFSFGFSALLGKAFALTRTTYEITSDNYLLVRSYDDSLLLAKYNTQDSNLTGEYRYTNNLDSFSFKPISVKHLNKR